MSAPKELSSDLTEDELSDLLDSALSDFCKNEEIKSKSTVGLSQENNSESESNTPKESSFNLNSENTPFKMFESDPELKECWSKLIKSCNEEVENDDNDFRESLHNTLKTISEKARDIAGDENILSEDEIAKTLANMAELNGATDGGENENNFELNNIMPLMSNIMENLLSKDFLYPTLSDLSKKYPDYLKEHEGKIPSEDYIRYEKQYKIIVEICEEFDGENESENPDAKGARFNRILILMQTMQTYGTPPPSLVSPNSINPESMSELNMFNQIDNSKCTLM